MTQIFLLYKTRVRKKHNDRRKGIMLFVVIITVRLFIYDSILCLYFVYTLYILLFLLSCSDLPTIYDTITTTIYRIFMRILSACISSEAAAAECGQCSDTITSTSSCVTRFPKAPIFRNNCSNSSTAILLLFVCFVVVDVNEHPLIISFLNLVGSSC